MKKQIILSFIVAAGLASCEKDLEMYSEPTCRLNFYYDIDETGDYKPEMGRSAYSFVYGDPNRTQDTVWARRKADRMQDRYQGHQSVKLKKFA